MVYSLTYRRPSHRSLAQSSTSSEEKHKSLTESTASASQSIAGIPDALSFDRIINGGTCPPCTLRDFMNYMKYIEHDVENLQFYLWLHDYTIRFSQLPASEQALSPSWSPSQADTDMHSANPAAIPASVAPYFEGTTFAPADPFRPSFSKSHNDSHTDLSVTATAFSDATITSFPAPPEKTWQPFTAQPYREEVAKIERIYLLPSSPRALNLTSAERASLSHALQNTTHPSAFRAALLSTEWTLRQQSHPNFIRWAIRNGNGARVTFARGLGVSVILLSLAASVLVTLAGVGRGWRAVPLVGYVIGISTLVAAWKGMCVVLHGMHHRHVRPWEMFGEEAGSKVSVGGGLEEEGREKEGMEVQVREGEGAEKRFYFDRGSLVVEQRNSWEDEPWVARYEKRNIVRKVFDREVWIKEPALRQVQDTIFVQSLLAAVLIGGVITGVFVAVPGGNFL
ncbi:hypothetical protein CAC42_2101 [Sphaceloma murrayae]|uniref:RGS domain-containing protein n=1 Tax=Sphaceloma murrayae TaxID=2082308 RepID=A0A2K1QIZ9_9PEZI|nr:hypothetical protein CAC42_2101 [Sphaceloma murrayae]